MLLLRLTSPESVIGLTSDDGFEIGQFTVGDTLDLLGAMTMLGGMTGVLYVAFRSAIPVRVRLPLWTGLWAVVGGSLFISEDGVDFTVLEPAALAIALFVALPGIAAATTVLFVERWSATEPWANRRLTVLVVVASLASTVALALAGIVMAIALCVRRSRGVPGVLRRIGLVLVPLGLTVIGVMAAVDLVRTSSQILD